MPVYPPDPKIWLHFLLTCVGNLYLSYMCIFGWLQPKYDNTNQEYSISSYSRILATNSGSEFTTGFCLKIQNNFNLISNLQFEEQALDLLPILYGALSVHVIANACSSTVSMV